MLYTDFESILKSVDYQYGEKLDKNKTERKDKKKQSCVVKFVEHKEN